MPDRMSVSWRHAALGLVLGVLLAGGALALTEWAVPDPGPAPTAPGEAAEDPHAMDDAARCAHMPEHCPPGASP